MSNKLIKNDETKFIPDDVRQDVIDGTAKVGAVTAFFVTQVLNGTAKVIGNGVAYAGRIIKKSEQNANLVHEVGHRTLATTHCECCGTQLIAVDKFCSNCGQKQ